MAAMTNEEVSKVTAIIEGLGYQWSVQRNPMSGTGAPSVSVAGSKVSSTDVVVFTATKVTETDLS
jgi:hypothetical protein